MLFSHIKHKTWYCKKCFRSESALILVDWICIRIGHADADPELGGKINLKIGKKWRHVFFWELKAVVYGNVLYWGNCNLWWKNDYFPAVYFIKLIGRQNPVPEIIDTVFAKTSPKRSFSMTEYDRFGLVFTKTRVYKLGHWIRNWIRLDLKCWIRIRRSMRIWTTVYKLPVPMYTCDMNASPDTFLMIIFKNSQIWRCLPTTNHIIQKKTSVRKNLLNNFCTHIFSCRIS